MTSPILLDRVARVAPIGLRFWDAITGAFIGVGLRVNAYHPAKPERRYPATTSRSNTYLIQGLPSLGNFEFEAETPKVYRRYRLVVEVEDALGRFLPFQFRVGVPVEAVYADLDCTPEGGSSPTIVSTERIPLFSAPTRLPPSPMAVIYAQLAERKPDPASGGEIRDFPASWAVLEARLGGVTLAQGIADRDGNTVLMFPYPELSSGTRLTSPPSSPPSSPPAFSDGAALPRQRWTVELRAFFTGYDSPPSPIPIIPELCRTLTGQAAVTLLQRLPGTALNSVTLDYGQECVVRTEGDTSPFEPLSMLLIGP